MYKLTGTPKDPTVLPIVAAAARAGIIAASCKLIVFAPVDGTSSKRDEEFY